MFIFKTLDVVIGIVFIFLLVSTVCTAVREGLEALLKTRAAYLERGIRELLHDREGTGLAKSLFNHPLLFGLFNGEYVPKQRKGDAPPLFAIGRGLPSYIPASSFALALLDIAARGPETDVVNSDPTSTPLTVQSIRDSLLNIASPAVRRALLTALDTSRGDLELARKNLEDWFDSSMDRVSGWYKRSTQWIVLLIAVIVTGALNIDTLAVTEHLYLDDQSRSALVEQARKSVEEAKKNAGEQPAKTVAAAIDKAESALGALEDLRLPIGWSEARRPEGSLGWFNRVLGLLITAMAATLGAPFWFDVLNKVMVIRSTVKPREKSPEEFSEDRQPPTAAAAAGAPGPAGGAALPAPLPGPVLASTVVLTPRDATSDTDCCDGAGPGKETPDEELPAAIGGVG